MGAHLLASPREEQAVRREALRVAATLAAAISVTGCNTAPAAPEPFGLKPPTLAPIAPTTPSPSPSPSPAKPSPTPTAAQLPLGGRTIFPRYRVVAYYGTAGNPEMGVLGEADPDAILPRLRAAAARFATPGRRIQVAYELIVTVALGGPGADGDYSHTIDPAKIEAYVEAARRNKVLLVLDVQPGRTDFLTEVKKLRPFLEEPYVGLALDPEWRVAAGQIPGRVIGSVRAAEVNAVSKYVADIVREHKLPEKLFLLHEFRSSMIPDIAAVQRRPGLAMVQHIDGFGTRSQKDATFAALRRPQQFHVGYKLFYDEDINMFAPRDVLRFRPTPEYISYQ
jgi:hypothetical protein